MLIYQRERERKHKQGDQQAEGEADAPLSREPDTGSIPEPWDHGSEEPKADT